MMIFVLVQSKFFSKDGNVGDNNNKKSYCIIDSQRHSEGLLFFF